MFNINHPWRTPMNLMPIKNTLQKILVLLCFLILPLLFYVLTAYLTAALFQALLRSMEKGSETALFLDANLPIIYSGAAALFTSSILGILYHMFRKNSLLSGFNWKTGSTSAASSPQADSRPTKKGGLIFKYFYAAAFGALGAIFFNLLLELSRLPELFPASGTIGAAVKNGNPLLHFLSVCLLIPIAEELVFRGFGYFGLRRLFSPVSAGVLTAVLFGVFHGNAPQTLYGFCMGLLLAHTAESFQNITALLFFHWAANITAFTLLGNPAGQQLIYSIPFLGLSGIGCAWLFCRIRDLEL